MHWEGGGDFSLCAYDTQLKMRVEPRRGSWAGGALHSASLTCPLGAKLVLTGVTILFPTKRIGTGRHGTCL